MAKKILLNVCCAPDATHSIEKLRQDGYEPVCFFYNPNIHPKAEYEKRLEALKQLVKHNNAKLAPDIAYDPRAWFAAAKKFKDEPERGRRCEVCFEMRMDMSARQAKENGFEIFATTLTISPKKDAALINTKGREASQKYGVNYMDTDFKKQDGYKKSVELTKKFGLYRQDYCGCSYSLVSRKKQKRQKA